MKPNLPRIYCDMDGVLCDFKKAAEKVTGMPITKWSYATKEEKWQLLADCIRSGQVEASELHEEFQKDPEFQKWYMKKYLMD